MQMSFRCLSTGFTKRGDTWLGHTQARLVAVSDGRFTRQSKSIAGVQQLVEHRDNEEIFADTGASRRNAERGIEKLRTTSMRKSYSLLKRACVAASVPVVRSEDYLLEISSKA